MKISQSVIDYIHDCQSQGVGSQQIREVLLKAGWPMDEVEAGLAQIHSGGSAPGSSEIVLTTPVSGTGEGSVSPVSKESYPKAVLQEYRLARWMSVVQGLCLLVFFYVFWKTARVPIESVNWNLVWMVGGLNVLVLAANQIFYFIIPVRNPMFSALTYINYFRGQDLSLLEVSRLCRQKLLEFAAFQVSFSIDFFLQSLKAFSNNEEGQKLLNNKQLIYTAKLYIFLLGDRDQTNMAQVADMAGKESQALFGIQKLAAYSTIRISYSIFISLAVLIILQNLGFLNVFVFFPVWLGMILTFNYLFSLKPFMELQKRTSFFYYGIFKDQSYIEYLKTSMPFRIMKPHLGLGFGGLVSSLLLLFFINMFFNVSPEAMGFLVGAFVIAFGYLVQQVIVQQVYYKQASLNAGPLGDGAENKTLQGTKSYLGIGATAPQAMHSYYGSLAVMFGIAFIPGINFVGSVMALHTIIHQKQQALTKDEFMNNRWPSVLLGLGIVSLIPLLGSPFALVGFVSSLVFRAKYKA